MNVEIEMGTKAEQLLFCNICYEFSVLCLCSAGAISDSKNGLVILYSTRLHLLSTMPENAGSNPGLYCDFGIGSQTL
jgi:hypothetical protein